MGKQMPVESEGLGAIRAGGSIIGRISGVNDESACLVEHFKPTQYELEVLARHYLENARDIEFYGRFLGASGSYEIRMHPFAYRRLATIKSVLGEKRLQEAIARTEEKWDEIFKRAEKDAKPCKACGGGERTYNTPADIGSEGYCDACDPATQGRSDLSGLPVTLTEEEVDAVRQRVEENKRRTETHISRMSGGPID